MNYYEKLYPYAIELHTSNDRQVLADALDKLNLRRVFILDATNYNTVCVNNTTNPEFWHYNKIDDKQLISLTKALSLLSAVDYSFRL